MPVLYGKIMMKFLQTRFCQRQTDRRRITDSITRGQVVSHKGVNSTKLFKCYHYYNMIYTWTMLFLLSTLSKVIKFMYLCSISSISIRIQCNNTQKKNVLNTRYYIYIIYGTIHKYFFKFNLGTFYLQEESQKLVYFLCDNLGH